MRNIEAGSIQPEKEITDLQMIGKVISSLFTRIPVSMYHENEQIPVQIISANNEGIVIKATERSDNGIRILTFTNNFSLYHFWFELSHGSNSDLEFLRPIKMVIREDAKRIENRAQISEKIDKKPTVSNIISQEAIFSNPEKLQKIKEKLLENYGAILRSKFENNHLKLESTEDLRMRIFKAGLRPIFLPTPGKLEPFNTAFFNPYQFKELLLAYDGDTIQGAEITVPILLKNRILIGYLKVHGDRALTLEDYTSIQKTANHIMDEIASNQELLSIPGEFTILDISSNGLGFSIPRTEKNKILCSSGSILVFDLSLGENRRFTLKAVCRFLKEENDLLRVGVEFYELTPDEKANLREFSRNLTNS